MGFQKKDQYNIYLCKKIIIILFIWAHFFHLSQLTKRVVCYLLRKHQTTANEKAWHFVFFTYKIFIVHIWRQFSDNNLLSFKTRLKRDKTLFINYSNFSNNFLHIFFCDCKTIEEQIVLDIIQYMKLLSLF